MEEPGVPGEELVGSVEVALGNENGTTEQEPAPPGADISHPLAKPKLSNVLPFHGNPSTMNLNPLILNNIQSSHYFKVELYARKTYHEVIDEMYHHVKHLEPWEKGSRKTAGQTGMCGGVRGVGAGGIVSTAFCILYKLYTLKLTRKQLNGLIHYDGAPHVRAMGFMYVRYTQPPADLWTWYEPFLEDEEEVEVRAGGGSPMTVGQIVRSMMTKLDWFSTLFPRIPVPVQKDLLAKLKNYDEQKWAERKQVAETEVVDRERKRSAPRDDVESRGSREKSHRREEDHKRSRSRDRDRRRSRSRDRGHSRKEHKKSKDRHRDRDRKDKDETRHKRRSRSRSHDRANDKRSKDAENDRREKRKRRSRSRSRDRRYR